MNVNGIWKMEILGAYDWEPLSTAFMEDGRYRGASADHYAVGSYVVDGNKVSIDSTVHVHGKIRTVFGKKAIRHDLHIEGTVAEGRFSGTAKGNDRAFVVTIRGTRISDLP